MSNYTHLNNIAVQGSIESSAQGKLIGSFDTMPAASSLNAGQIVLYTGATGTYVQGKYYVSNGTSWVISAASPSAVTVDSALSDTSTNPVQNKVIKAALDAKVPAVSGKGLSTNDYTTAEKTKLSGIEAGAQVNKVTDVTVNGATVVGADKVAAINLSNYATKGDLSAIPKFAISVVSSLPTSDISASTIYLKSNGGFSGNSYDEYLYVNGAWEKIGTTEVDLSGYVPKTRKVNNKALSTDITLTAGDVGALPADGTAVKATADANGNNIANTYATQTALTNGLAAKQNALTFDSAPTSGSSNPVTSGGVFSAINSLESQIPSGGEAGQVWTSDGAGAGTWADAPSGITKTTVTETSYTFNADDWLPGDYFVAAWMQIDVSSNTIEFNNIVGWFIKSYNKKLYFRFSASFVYDYSTSNTLNIVDGTLEINNNSTDANSLKYVTGSSTSIVSKSSVIIKNWINATFIHLR